MGAVSARVLVGLHADLLRDADLAETIARRADPERAECERHDAHRRRVQAAALAEAVRALHPDVHVPNPAQFSLLADGGPL